VRYCLSALPPTVSPLRPLDLVGDGEPARPHVLLTTLCVYRTQGDRAACHGTWWPVETALVTTVTVAGAQRELRKRAQGLLACRKHQTRG